MSHRSTYKYLDTGLPSLIVVHIDRHRIRCIFVGLVVRVLLMLRGKTENVNESPKHCPFFKISDPGSCCMIENGGH